MTSKIEQRIYGCKVNKYYLNKWLSYFEKNSVDGNNFLVASCVVTDRAKNKWLKEVIHQLENWSKVYITGCGTLDRWRLISEKDFYDVYPELVKFKNKIFLLAETPEKSDYNFSWTKNIYTKKFIVIQNGCDNYCTFCLTVLKRWKSRNRPAEEIIKEIQDFESQWWKEIVITGINLAARWASDTKKINETKFPELLQKILDETNVPRILISSIGPEYINSDLLEILENPRIMPHFHISVQSFSDNVLEKMKRNYSSDDLKKALKWLQNLKRKYWIPISIWADIIVGFPGESDSDFLETCDGVKEFITKAHIFPFSAHDRRDWVPAWKLQNQISNEVKKYRKNKLSEIAEETRDLFLKKNIWITHNVLVEWIKNGKVKWWTENYIQVDLDWSFKRGDIIKVKFEKAHLK